MWMKWFCIGILRGWIGIYVTFRGSESEREREGFMGNASGEREWGMLVGLSREIEV